MSKIDISAWKKFPLGKLFHIEKGTRLTKANMKEGDINFIGASSFNNGVTAKIGNIEHLHPANTITVSYNGSVGETFYQTQEYWASDDVNVLYPNFALNEYIAMFLLPIIKLAGQQYAFIDKWKKEDMEKDSIPLPANIDGDPDWEYMETYIKDKISVYKSNIQTLTAITPEKIERINVGKWKKFVIGELFPKIIKPDVIHAKSVSENDEGLAYVVRSKFNNGIKCKVSPKPCYKPSPAGTISFGAENATFFYQPQEYISGRDIYYIDTRHLSKEVCLFLTTCLQTIAKQYSYNNGLFPDLLKKETIWLPITAEGKPDWNYMENTIRNLMHNSEQYIKAINYA